jgi:arylsulfatase A-like enzyme
MVFDNAYIGSYPCMPARQDFWTGRLNFLWRGWSPLEYAEDDLVSILHRAGKPSMLITDHYHLWNYGSGNYHMSFSGVEFIRGQERDNWRTDPDVPIRWPARPSKLNHMWERYARNTAHRRVEEDFFPAQVFSRAIQWVEDNHTLEDFFLLIDCFDPHEPFDPPQEYVELYDPGYEGESLVWPRYGTPATHEYSAGEINHCHALYCGEITLVDRWLGRFMDKVEERSLLSNTAIIVTSDHGFLFGEHDWIGKHSPTLYQHIVHTPLILYHPHQRQPGGRVAALAQMLDLQPTVLECLGLKTPAGIHGRSLVPLVTDQRDDKAREMVIFGVFGGSVYATDGDWVFVKRPVPENAPLNWYTLSHFNQWEFGQVNDVQATRQRLQQYKDGRFPAWYGGDTLNHGGPSPVPVTPRRVVPVLQDSIADELYHVSTDYQQTENLATQYPELVERFRGAIAAYVQKIEAPDEQLDRLGLRSYV